MSSPNMSLFCDCINFANNTTKHNKIVEKSSTLQYFKYN